MRILLVNKFLYPKGGAEIVCLGLAEQLRRRGHETFLFGMADERNAPDPDADCFVANIDYHARRTATRKAGEAVRTIYNLRARGAMARILDRHRPDLVHMHNIYHQLTPAILAPARRRGIPVLLTLHDYKLVCPVYTLLREGRPCEACVGRLPWPVLAHRCKNSSLAESAVLFAEALVHRLGRSYARGVTRFTAPSLFLRDMIVKGGLDPSRIAFLPNALPLPEAQIAAPWAPAPAREIPELIWIGRMSEEKGLPTLLAALAASRRPLRLLLVGDGPEEEALKSLASQLQLGERLRFLGRQPRSAIPGLLAGADGSVLPSEWYENAPLSLLESLALGRPVIASRIGGIPEILRDGLTGWLFPPGNREALREALDAWSASPDERARRGREAYADARTRFGPEPILDQTLELYESLLVRVH